MQATSRLSTQKQAGSQLDIDEDRGIAVDDALADIDAAFFRIAGKNKPAARDYYQLAVLSELADSQYGESRRSFSEWLVLGVKAYPRNQPLQTLLVEYAGTRVPVNSASQFLRLASHHLEDGQFYLVTESLWAKLVAEMPFEDWLALLNECETRVHLKSMDARDAFRIRLLHRVIWHVPQSWSSKTIASLELEASSLHPDLQADLDFICALRDLLAARDSLDLNHPAITRLLEFLEASCCADQQTETLKILRLANAIANDEHGLREALDAVHENVGYLVAGPTLMAFRKFGYLAHNELESNKQEKDELAASLIKEIWRSSLPQDLSTIYQKYRFVYPIAFTVVWMMVSATVLYWPVAMLPPAAHSPYLPWVIMATLVSTLAFGIASWRIFYPRFWSAYEHAESWQCIWQHFQSRFRERLFRYFRGFGEGSDQAISGLAGQAGTKEARRLVELLYSCCRADPALLIFAEAQRFSAK